MSENVAQLVIAQFFLGVREGRFPKLNDRNDLWQVLMLILERRVIDLRRRAPEPVCNELGIQATALNVSPHGGIDMVASLEPTPDTIVQLKEELARRLEQLPESLRQVAVWNSRGEATRKSPGF